MKTDLLLLAHENAFLKDNEIEHLNRAIKVDSGDIESRVKLLGYYFLKQDDALLSKKRNQHIKWVVENIAEYHFAGSPYVHIDSSREYNKKDYAVIKNLWLKIAQKSDNIDIVNNAALFIGFADEKNAEALFIKCTELDSKNPIRFRNLGRLYIELGNKNTVDSELKKKALIYIEKAYSLTAKEHERYYMLSDLATLYFENQQFEKAQETSEELLHIASDHKDNWNYGNAIYSGHQILGRIALSKGRTEEAKSQMLLSAKTPGSPQLNSFGPNMVFAKEMLDMGERETVKSFLKLCYMFWGSGKKKLLKWISILDAGEMPIFD